MSFYTVDDGREGGDDPAPACDRRRTLASGTRMDATRSDPMGERTVPAMEALDPAVETPDPPQQRRPTSRDRRSTPAPVSEGEEEQWREATFTWACSLLHSLCARGCSTAQLHAGGAPALPLPRTCAHRRGPPRQEALALGPPAPGRRRARNPRLEQKRESEEGKDWEKRC